MARTENNLTKDLDKINLGEENEGSDDILDDAIINALKGEHKAFSLQVEKFLNEFMLSDNTNELMGNMDKYQRKIVHKICDLYGVKRDYVDVKANELGDITITKCLDSKIPSQSLEKRYASYLEVQKKQAPKQIVNPLANKKKMLIKPRIVKKADSGSDSSDSNQGDQNEGKNQPTEVEQKKQKEYEQARVRIMEDQVDSSKVPEEQQIKPKEILEKPKKKGLRSDQFFVDPDYDRSKITTNNFNSNIGLFPSSTPFYPFGYNQQNPMSYNGIYNPNYASGLPTQLDQLSFNDFPPLATDSKSQKKK